MNTVEISVEGVEPPEWMAAAESFAKAVLSELGKEGWELSVLLCGDEFIRALNSQYRDRDAPTDVLSFEQGEWYQPGVGNRRFLAGDIVISLETLGRNCLDLGIPQNEELKRLVLHGILHLAGYDHDESDSRGEMLDFQESLLKKFSEVILL